ncbi:MAG: hypothetical protein JSS32_02260 [Verrucomicrobia bacterium]|nr:hypothetical protein [Verrucomicrobiota bacterium]
MWNIRIKFILAWCLCILGVQAGQSEVDAIFERLLSNAGMVEDRQIKIPGYPNAYNPSIVPYKGGYLLSFRFRSNYPDKYRDQYRTDLSFIGLVRLDKKFRVAEKTIQLLNVMSFSPRFSLSAEDARLMKIGDKVYIFFNDLPFSQILGHFAMYFGELVEEREGFVMKERAKLLTYAHSVALEKNWSPFVSGDRLYVIYSDQPRVILEVDLDTGYCNEVARTRTNWNWDHGGIRGGTPAYLVDGKFLTFFHSSFAAKIPKGRAYVMGAYTFDAEPPFTVRRITPRPLGQVIDYTEDNAPKVVYPGGMVIEDRYIHVARGKADSKIFITTFDKEALFSSMEPCSE